MHFQIARALFVPSLMYEVAAWCATSRRWWDRVDDHLILGALPTFWHVPHLHASGVRRVINLCTEYGGPGETYRRYGIEQLRLPTYDFTPPTLETIERAVAEIGRTAASGETIYLHCKAGRGRSATVAVCWLMHRDGLSAVDAEGRLRRIRSQIDRDLHRRRVVIEFSENLRRRFDDSSASFGTTI